MSISALEAVEKLIAESGCGATEISDEVCEAELSQSAMLCNTLCAVKKTIL
jgi:hypothetical protein